MLELRSLILGHSDLLRPIDVPFPTVLQQCHTEKGSVYFRRMAYGMPKLGQYTQLLRTVFFLYPTRKDAEQGSSSGGTGFLVAVPTKRWPTQVHHVHAITNYHVAVFNDKSSPSPVIKVAHSDGQPEYVELDPFDWVFRPNSFDIAISPPLDFSPSAGLAFLEFNSYLLTEAEEKRDEIGAADDVMMIGRFVDYQGVETNAPAVRFGHISILDAHIKQRTGYVGRSIVLDMHSRSGFSGSPVFIYRTLGSHFLEEKPNSILIGGGHYFKLLGIHWGQFPELWELKNKYGVKSSAQREAALVEDGQYVEGLSGMTLVIPSANIRDILYLPELEAMRDKREDEILRVYGSQLATAPKAESAAPKDKNPKHKEDFNSLLDKAVTRKKSKG